MSPEDIEKVARVLCARQGYDPDRLEPGDIAIQPHWHEVDWREADYDNVSAPDGKMPNGDPAHFIWRQFIFDAQAVLRALDEPKP